MRVLIVIEKNPTKRFLVRLLTKASIREIRDLVDNGKHSQAMAKAISQGRFEREVSKEELPALETDLILSRNSARWDLMK